MLSLELGEWRDAAAISSIFQKHYVKFRTVFGESALLKIPLFQKHYVKFRTLTKHLKDVLVLCKFQKHYVKFRTDTYQPTNRLYKKISKTLC